MIYFNKKEDGSFEVLDEQQRITSIGRFLTGKFSIIGEQKISHYFSSLPKDQQDKINGYKILVCECEGGEKEMKDWFETINIQGIPLNHRELMNAIYSGTLVTAVRAQFSTSQSAKIQKWSSYVVKAGFFWDGGVVVGFCLARNRPGSIYERSPLRLQHKRTENIFQFCH